MAIYKMVGDKERLDKVEQTSFGQEGVLERVDLQRILRDQPEVLEEGLLIISEEFGNWQDSNRRIDLLALDSNGRLVVIELKRGDTGEHMDLQAIRYAAMVANMTYQQAVAAHQTYLDKRTNEGITFQETDAETRIREHLGSVGEEPMISSGLPRIILAAEGFSKELTTCALWLNDCELDIKCIQLTPFRTEQEFLVEASQILPLPEATEFIEQIRELGRENREQRPKRAQHLPGGDPFKESIIQVPEKLQGESKRLYDWAVRSEQDGLAELSTYVNGKEDYFRLDVRVQGKGQPLVSPSNVTNKKVELAFWLDNFESFAPIARSKVHELVKFTNAVGGMNYRTLSKIPDLDSLLTALTDAYREANGLLTDYL